MNVKESGEGGIPELKLTFADGGSNVTWVARPAEDGIEIEEGYLLIPWKWIAKAQGYARQHLVDMDSPAGDVFMWYHQGPVMEVPPGWVERREAALRAYRAIMDAPEGQKGLWEVVAECDRIMWRACFGKDPEGDLIPTAIPASE